jgi:hypothetical protein
MEKCHFQEMYPVYAKEFSKTEIRPQSLDDVCQYFNDLIATHPFAKYICTFDHYSHTAEIEGGFIDEAIMSAKNVVFCFGKKLGDPKVLSIRPRSIGICETDSHFVISFLEAPNPALTETMITWVRNLVAY